MRHCVSTGIDIDSGLGPLLPVGGDCSSERFRLRWCENRPSLGVGDCHDYRARIARHHIGDLDAYPETLAAYDRDVGVSDRDDRCIV